MPIMGFRVGDIVLTPSGKRATVTNVKSGGGRERVYVAFYGWALADRWFFAQALKLVERDGQPV